MNVEIKDKALIRNIKYLTSVPLENGKKATPTDLVESALSLFFSAINKRAERIKKGN